jgi:hypothetical protein
MIDQPSQGKLSPRDEELATMLGKREGTALD